MADISKRLEQVVKSILERSPLIPQKTDQGILVGEILIKSRDNLKDLYHRNELLYSDISLNKSAIFIANSLALRRRDPRVDKIYRADQIYGKFYIDSQYLRSQYEKAVKSKNFERADMLWARYEESRDRAANAKNLVDKLIDN